MLELLGDLSGKTVAVWGLSYKPGTDSIRRSGAIELCRWLTQRQALVQAFDPAVKELPDDLKEKVRLCASAAEALSQADARSRRPNGRNSKIPAEAVAGMRTKVIVDAGGFLGETLGRAPHVRYAAVGAA